MKYTLFFGEVYARGVQVSHDGVTRYCDTIEEAFEKATQADATSLRMRDTATFETFLYCASYYPLTY